jgi:hypothetical protein
VGEGKAVDFAWQHHARFLDPDWTILTVFDNHQREWENPVNCRGRSCSRGLKLKVSYTTMSAEFLQEFYSPEGIGAYAMGSYDELPNGNALIGWGSMASFSEYTPQGDCVLDVFFGRLDTWVRTYRVYKADWHAQPLWPPSIAATTIENTIHVSWNGATEVRSWTVFVADNVHDLLNFAGHDTELREDLVLTTAPRAGFETTVWVGDEGRYARVAALDRWKKLIGVTGIVDMWTGEIREMGDEMGWAVWRDQIPRMLTGR